MSEFKVNKDKNEIIYDGISFKLDEVKALLKKYNIELFRTVSCPGEVKFVITEEAKIMIRQKREEMNVADS